MPTNPLGTPRFRAFDANGNPLSGGKLHTYQAGTTTPLATYTTRAGDVANANPVVLDANGEADVWLSPSLAYKFELKNSAGVTQWTVDNYPSAAEASASTDEAATEPGGRLTLTSATPVTTADVTAATTIYYTEYKSNKVPLYNGSTWALHSIQTEISQATADATKSPAAVAADSNYDLFVWDDAGTVRLSRGPAWTSATARGTGAGTTELTRINGRYVNKVSITNGPGALRGLYVGTVRSNATSTIDDTLAKRLVWNMYNRRTRALRVLFATVWGYGAAVWRQSNASSANQVNFVVGLEEDSVAVRYTPGRIFSSAVGQRSAAISLGLDSITAPAAASTIATEFPLTNAIYGTPWAAFTGMPGLGHHYVASLEKADGTDTQNFDGSNSSSQGGIFGEVLA